MHTIGILGGTGFVGSRLSRLLVDRGFQVIIFTRDVAHHIPEKNLSYAHWNLEKGACDINALKTVDAIINLAGAGIADKRWTAARKQEIINSRVQTTKYLVNQLQQYASECKVFVAASAIGYYGADSGGAPFNETAPPSDDFLGETCRLWENESLNAQNFMRTVVLRFGIVLGKESGALPQLAMPLNFRIVPVMGDGTQIMSWITVDDLAEMLLFSVTNNQIAGIYNAVAPHPVSNRQLMEALVQVKGGPFLTVPAPAFLLKAVLGEMSVEILKSCTADAGKIQQKGFTFNHPYILDALNAIYCRNKTKAAH